MNIGGITLKKLVITLISAIVTISLTACAAGTDGTPQRELDILSMRDTELGVVVSIGDSQSDVETILGQPMETVGMMVIGDGAILEFQNGMEVTFEHDAVISISAINGFTDGRFEIYGYRAGMTTDEIAANFGLLEEMSEMFSSAFGGTVLYYANFFDAQGNPADMYSAMIANLVFWEDARGMNQITLSVVSYEE